MDIYVGNLPYDIDEQTVIDAFAAYGSVARIKMITDRETGRPKGFGFVTMDDWKEAQAAIKALENQPEDAETPRSVPAFFKMSLHTGRASCLAKQTGEEEVGEAYDELRKIRTLTGADPESLELGETLYRAGIKQLSVAACSACHSPTGNGNAPAGFPSLSGQHPEYTLLQLKAFRSGERQNDQSSMMRAVVERLTDQELEALASYVSGLN